MPHSKSVSDCAVFSVNRDQGSKAFKISMKMKENNSKKSLPVSLFLMMTAQDIAPKTL